MSAAFEGGEGTLSVSADAGKTWQAAGAGDVSALVRQKYDVWVKAEFPGALAKFGVEAVIEHNRGALPHLLPGKNVVTASLGQAALPKGCVVTVTYAYQEATAPAGNRQFNGAGIAYGEPKTVARDLAASPTTFTIDVGGNAPPRMLWLERAVRGK